MALSKKSNIWIFQYLHTRANILLNMFIAIVLSLGNFNTFIIVFLWLIQLRIIDDWMDRHLDKQMHQRMIMLQNTAGVQSLASSFALYLIILFNLNEIQIYHYHLFTVVLFIWYYLRPHPQEQPLSKIVIQIKYPIILLIMILPLHKFNWIDLISLIIVTIIANIYEFKTEQLLQKFNYKIYLITISAMLSIIITIYFSALTL